MKENSSVKILLVDDREENLFALEVILSSENYLCMRANSGKEALKILRHEQDFAIILLDVQMPGMDGFETLEFIRKIENLKLTPVIFLTAGMDAEQVYKGYQAGAVDYIIKPFLPEILKAKVAVFVDLYKKTNELLIQYKEKKKRASELMMANKELAYQNVEKEKRANELIIADKELDFQNVEKGKRAAELIIANKELVFQNREKEKRADELMMANKELAYQNEEKEKRADELGIANKELAYQNEEKEKRAAELIIANKKLVFQNVEKGKRAAELIIANKELTFQNREKEKRADELIIANKELVFQNEEKEKRANELIIADKELVFQKAEKGKRAAELIITNKEYTFHSEDLEERVKERTIALQDELLERQKAEEQVKKLNRVYTVLSNINQTIIHERDKQTLNNEVCRIAVEDGKFRMAWIGMVDPQTNKVNPVASCGFINGYLKNINIDLNGEKLSQGPTGRAIMSGTHYLANNIANDPEMIPWRDDALKLDYKSSAAFPINVFGKTIGAIMLYSDEQFFFDKSEVKLLDEMAMDISFTIEYNKNEIERKLTARRQQLSSEILSILNDPSAFTDTIDRILTAIKHETDFDAIGTRLRIGDDFPYFVQKGFSDDFMRTENTLTARDNSELCMFENGKPCLECTCGLVISGKTDPSNSLYTKGGSFWTNNSMIILDLPFDKDARLNPRNRCIIDGYNSVALIPIRLNNEIIGLLQLNDRRKDSFTLDMIQYYEQISESIGVAIKRYQAEEEIKKLNETLKQKIERAEQHASELIIANIELDFQNEEKEKRAAELIIANKELIFQNGEKDKRAAELVIADKELLYQEKGKRAAELVIADKEIIVQNIVKEKQVAENKELEAFSYSVSHDLHGPLRHIGGFADLLVKNNSPQLDETGLRYLKIISESVLEMENLIDALLTFSRLSNTELQRTKINSKNMVTRVIKTFSEELAGRNVKINISELPDAWGDENLINQVWVNLISNALKYSRKKEKAVIEIGGKIENDQTIFYVKDNGVGFDMKYSDKLFGVFQRLHKAKDFEGVGIGLANVNRIVMRHGGKCWAESEVGKGSTFFFSNPNH